MEPSSSSHKHETAADTPQSHRGEISRRAFGKAAVAIGGTAALAACFEWENDDVEIPTGVSDVSSLPLEQHAWDEYLTRDDHENAIAPRHHVLLLMELPSDGPPSTSDRETVQSAFHSLERAYEWSHQGLVFTIGYSPAYFDRFESTLPNSVDLPDPEPLASFEDPSLDRPDAILHLASDHPSVVLEAEEALFGEVESVNGQPMDTTLEGVFHQPDSTDTTVRRTGFVGEGLPADNTDMQGIPDEAPVADEAPLFMNFKSGFEKNQASESRITIQDGPFAGGTTQHVSKIRLNLDQWYEQDSRSQRVGKMFCPVHAEEDRVEGPGHNLGSDSGMDGDCIDDIDQHAREYGMVGHSQKMAAESRRDDQPIMIRRDFNSTDDGHTGLHFVALQESITDFIDTRQAMNGARHAETSGIGQRLNNGILQYMRVLRRGNYLIPPREHRALPPPTP